MRLSEAIRLGSMLRPQCHGVPAGFISTTDTIGTCALGAALEAVGYPIASLLGISIGSTEARRMFPFLSHEVLDCPACMSASFIMGTILHLNDEHRWTREQIADWVEGIENQMLGVEQAPEVQQPEPAVQQCVTR